MYIIFTYSDYYPAGGPHDIFGVYKTLHRAQIDFDRILDGHTPDRNDYVDLYDVKANEIIRQRPTGHRYPR